MILPLLQSASGPSREIDYLIFVAVGPVNEDHCKSWCTQNGRTDLTREQYLRAWAPSYTASLDAALTLVPQGYNYVLRSLPHATEARVGGALAVFVIKGGEHSVPAIALCIAALKARGVE